MWSLWRLANGMVNAAQIPEGTMAEQTDEPKQETKKQEAEERRPRTPDTAPEPSEALREDVAEDDRFQSTDN